MLLCSIWAVRPLRSSSVPWIERAQDKVEPFLRNLFQDNEIIPLGPFQERLGAFIASRRSGKIREQYAAIGGGSPIGHWTAVQACLRHSALTIHGQGAGMVERLDKISPETAPHKVYTAFRYADPDTEAALTQMKEDGVERAVAFSQFPQFSCTTTGSSLNHLWREQRRLGLGDSFKWSVLDRWPEHPGFIQVALLLLLSVRCSTRQWQRMSAVGWSNSLPMCAIKCASCSAHTLCL